MEAKQGVERGILKAKAKPEPMKTPDNSWSSQLTPQGSYEKNDPSSPHPSVDRFSVTFAEPEETMASSGINLFHLPSETAITNEVKFSSNTGGDGSEDEDYSASLSAIIRQRRASVRRSRKGRTRRPSSPFIPDETRSRRRSSVFTTSSGETAISIEEYQAAVVTQQEIFENIHLHKEVLGSVRQQPLGMRRKLKIVNQAKNYIKKHEGQLQERLAQSKRTRDIYARCSIFITTKWQQIKREAANMSNVLIPWELRIKEIESHFGSVVASYFTFLRWLFWVNLVIGFILMVFVIVPEYLTTNVEQDGERKIIMDDERRNSTNLLTLWEFDGVLKCSPIFYGYYTNVERPEYRMPLAYFLTGLVVYIYSFVATLKKMAQNSRMSKLSEKEDECIFSWKLFTGWDFMIGNAETAHNRIASVILGFKEALLEEAEKKKDLRNWRVISLRAFVNICVVILLAVSAYAVVSVVSTSDDSPMRWHLFKDNDTTLVVTIISITFPLFFEVLGFLEHYHPRKQLRLQLARIMLLNLLNLYSLIFAMFSKIEGMSRELDSLKPPINGDINMMPEHAADFLTPLETNLNHYCNEIEVQCCDSNHINIHFYDDILYNSLKLMPNETVSNENYSKGSKNYITSNPFVFIQNNTRLNIENLFTSVVEEELNRLRKIAMQSNESILDEWNFIEDKFDLDDYQNNITDYLKFFNLTLMDGMNDSYSTPEIINTNSDITTDYGDMNSFSTTESLPDYEKTTLFITDDIYSENPTYTNDVSESSFKIINITENSGIPDATSQITTEGYTSSLLTTESTSDYTKSMINTLSNNSTEEYLTDTVDDYTQSFYYNTTEKPTKTDRIQLVNITCPLVCPNISLNNTVYCNGKNITQVLKVINCTVIEKKCYFRQCKIKNTNENSTGKNATVLDIAFYGEDNRTMYNLSIPTKKKLVKLCWETMFGQELIKLTMMDLVFVVLGCLFIDFFRALLVRYMNRCWCWDLEKRFPEYGDFKIAENILHLINNQGMVWMGMFFSPGLVVLNVIKLVIMMYLRSWAVMTCNVPHEVVFRVSKSNNFYLALLLTMLFLCVLPVGYSIVWVKPSWHCGPFSEYDKIYHILTNNIHKTLPPSLHFILEYIASPAIVIPLLVLLILIIYYLTSLTNSLREANNDLKIQLRRERTEERRKMFQLADTRRRTGSSALDNTPFARWKRALPSLPFKSIDSDDRKTNTGEDNATPKKNTKKRGRIFEKIVSLALDRKLDIEAYDEAEPRIQTPSHCDDETDTEFHETLPKDLLNSKNVNIHKEIESKTIICETHSKIINTKTKPFVHVNNNATTNSQKEGSCETNLSQNYSEQQEKDKPLDLIGTSIIPVIMISATESDEEMKSEQIMKEEISNEKNKQSTHPKPIEKQSGSDSKSLRRQSSVDSLKDMRNLIRDKTNYEQR